jgi:hypothetical protein
VDCAETIVYLSVVVLRIKRCLFSKKFQVFHQKRKRQLPFQINTFCAEDFKIIESHVSYGLNKNLFQMSSIFLFFTTVVFGCLICYSEKQYNRKWVKETFTKNESIFKSVNAKRLPKQKKYISTFETAKKNDSCEQFVVTFDPYIICYRLIKQERYISVYGSERFGGRMSVALRTNGREWSGWLAGHSSFAIKLIVDTEHHYFFIQLGLK